MKINFLRVIISATVLVFLLLLNLNLEVDAHGLMQQPTIAIPTVTGTPVGVTVSVNLNQEDFVNVRSGPGVFFDKIGDLLPGQKAPALGKTAGGDWIMIEYPGVPGSIGWVYAPIVIISGGDLPIVEPPPTPTPAMTQTIDPTLAAQFIETPVPTRLPTYTVAPPVSIPTFTDYSASSPGGIPMGLVILVLAGLGILVGLFSFLQAR